MIKVCGCGPDIVKIDEHEEIGCHCGDVRIRFTDSTEIFMYYDGNWNIEVVRRGTADMGLCLFGGDDRSDEFYIDAKVLTFEVIDR